MSTNAGWSVGVSLFGLVLATAAPKGDGCGGHGGSCAGGSCTGTTASGGGGAGAGGATTTPSGAGLTLLATTSGGNGCPAVDSVDAWFDAAAGTLILTYPPFSVSKSSPGFDHASCATGLTVKGVPGWQFAATGTRVHGGADLPTGAKAKVQANVFFAGIPATGEWKLELTGPRFGDFDDTAAFPSGSLLWSPCGQDAILNLQAGESLQTQSADPAAAEVRTISLPISWREC